MRSLLGCCRGGPTSGEPQSPPQRSSVAEFITKDGDLRTLPCHFPDSDSRLAGLDGFYAAKLLRL